MQHDMPDNAGDESLQSDFSLDDEGCCELMLEALHEHLSLVEERLVALASDLLPTLTPPPGYNRPDADAPPPLNSREEERRRIEEDELREAKEKEKAKNLAEKMHHLEVLANKERQYTVNKRRYVKLLSLRTEQQQLEAKRRQKRFEKQREKEQAKRKAELLKRKPVRYKSDGETDDRFLIHLPQTLFYKIVAIESELKRRGELNNIQDVKDFWDKMLAPPAPAAEQTTSLVYRHTKDAFIEEDENNEVTNSWAITASVPTMKNKFPELSTNNTEPAFVPTQTPVLRPLSEILSHDIDFHKKEEEKVKRHKARVELRQVQSRVVKEMYQTARANETATRRLLQEAGLVHEEPTKLFPEADHRTKERTSARSIVTGHKANHEPVKRARLPHSKANVKQTSSELTFPSPTNTIETLNEAQSQQERHMNKPVPLHIGAVEKDAPVKEARQTSLWKNYAKDSNK